MRLTTDMSQMWCFLLQADDILCEVKSQLRTPLSVVMETEMKDIYGNLW